MNEKTSYTLTISERFKNLIPPLNKEEFQQLEKNLLYYGCRDAICVWNNIIVDGHNRYAICKKHNLPFNIQILEFKNIEQAEIWICSNQLGRRNISEETKRYLIGKRYLSERKINKNPLGHNQYTNIEQIKNTVKKQHYSLTATKLGDEHKI